LEHAAELVAGAGSASIAGATAKTGTIVVVTGAVAGRLAGHGTPLPGHHSQHHRRAAIAARYHRATAPVRLPAPHAGTTATSGGRRPATAAAAATIPTSPTPRRRPPRTISGPVRKSDGFRTSLAAAWTHPSVLGIFPTRPHLRTPAGGWVEFRPATPVR